MGARVLINENWYYSKSRHSVAAKYTPLWAQAV